ncbi:MAG: hypothetical protein ACQCN3_15465 [Candidatus Bathyarchaeia archaeon]|jgi:hypothetical protein
MPKREVSILQANGKTIILEGTVGLDYRLSIPKQLRKILKPNSQVKITIDILGTNVQTNDKEANP